MLSVKKAKAVEAPASPADPMQPFRDLQARIEAFKAELDTYIDEHCRVIGSGASGAPFENIKMMVTSRINCQCNYHQNLERKGHHLGDGSAGEGEVTGWL